MEISNKQLNELVKAWEGHVDNGTNCDSCGEEPSICPIHRFFMDIKKSLSTSHNSDFTVRKPKVSSPKVCPRCNGVGNLPIDLLYNMNCRECEGTGKPS